MTTLTVNIEKDSDLNTLRETLDKLGLSYDLSNQKEFNFTEDELEGFVNTYRDCIDGKMTTRSWDDVKHDLDSAFN